MTDYFEKLRQEAQERMDKKVNHPRNQEILRECLEGINSKEGPRVGDWVYMKGEDQPRRFTYDWGDDIQTTDRPGDMGSFHISEYGCSYSGALDPGLPKNQLVLTDEVKEGRVWWFDMGWAGAGRGIETKVPFRVYKQV